MDHARVQLERMGGGPETIELALNLLPEAKLKTAPGSGHELGKWSTGLVPICGLISSQRLNNGEITVVNAQSAACLEKSVFAKALHIVKAALDSRTDQISYDILMHKYSINSILRTRLSQYFRDVQNKMQMLGIQVGSKNFNVIYGIFFWVCIAANIEEIGETQTFAAAHQIPLRKLVDFAHHLNQSLSSLRQQISKESQRLASPAKAATTSTPRRSPRKQRELPTKDSSKKRQSAIAQSNQEIGGDVDMTTPETPTKKRRVDSPSRPIPFTSNTTPQLAFPPIASSSSTSHINTVLSALPTTPRKHDAVGVKSSPLKQATVIADLDVDMDGSSSCEESETQLRRRRRFRPIYFEHKQWNLRDPRLSTIWKRDIRRKGMAESGHPFQQLST